MSLTPLPPSAPESIVTDLEHSRMLKEAGWPQEDAIFYWIKHASSARAFLVTRENMLMRDQETLEVCFPARTAEEILRRLPREIIFDGKHLFLKAEPNAYHHLGRGWKLRYETGGGAPEFGSGEHDSLANAAAAMYCCLANNGLLPTEA